jgi:hypothetical protein
MHIARCDLRAPTKLDLTTGTIPFCGCLLDTTVKPQGSVIMPVILWLMGVPLVVVVLLMLTHVI